MPRIAANAVSDHRARAAHRRVDDRVATRVRPARDVALDLVDQDHGVAHDHAGERDQPEQRHEAERPAGESSASDAPMIPSGAVTNTSASREKLCSWTISSASIATTITGKTATSEAVGLVAFLDRAARSRCGSRTAARP